MGGETQFAHGSAIHQLAMAADAVFLHHPFACTMDADGLGLQAKGEHGRMAQAVHALEEVFPHQGILGHMAIIAVGDGEMTAGLPGGELGAHDMAIDAGFGPIRQIAGGFRNSKYQRAKACGDAGT